MQKKPYDGYSNLAVRLQGVFHSEQEEQHLSECEVFLKKSKESSVI